MYNDGDILRFRDLKDPSGGTLYGLFKRALNLVAAKRSDEILEEPLILPSLVKVCFMQRLSFEVRHRAVFAQPKLVY